MNVTSDFRSFGGSGLYTGVVDRAAPMFAQVSRIGKMSLRGAAPHRVRRGRKFSGEAFLGSDGFRQATTTARAFGRGATRSSSLGRTSYGGALARQVRASGIIGLSSKIGIQRGPQLSGARPFAAVGTRAFFTRHSRLPAGRDQSRAGFREGSRSEGFASVARRGGEPVHSSIGASAGLQVGSSAPSRSISVAPRGMALPRLSGAGPADAEAATAPEGQTRKQETAAKNLSKRMSGRQTSIVNQVDGSDPERLVDFLSERASRPPRGITGIDPRLGPIYPGGFGRQW